MFVFGVILVRIHSECGKIRNRIPPNTDTFYVLFLIYTELLAKLKMSNKEVLNQHLTLHPNFHLRQLDFELMPQQQKDYSCLGSSDLLIGSSNKKYNFDLESSCLI